MLREEVFTRGTVRSFVYSLDFLLFLTARRRHGLLLPAMLHYVPVCFIILLFASSKRVLLVFSYIFTLLFIFCFACKTTAMFNRFVSIYGSIIAKNGGEKRSREDFCIFCKREISTTGIFLLADDVDSGCTNWSMALADSFIETQRKGSRNVIKGFPFNDYSCGFPSVGETLTLH